MAEYRVEGVEDVITRHQVVTVEIEGARHVFSTAPKRETAAVDAQAFRLASIEPDISSHLRFTDFQIARTEDSHLAYAATTRLIEAGAVVVSTATPIVAEMNHYPHEITAEAALGLFAVSLVAGLEMHLHGKKQRTQEKIATLREERGRLSSLHRAALPRGPKRLVRTRRHRFGP